MRTEEKQCESTFGGKLAPIGFGVKCCLPKGHEDLHRAKEGGSWITVLRGEITAVGVASDNWPE